MTKKAKEKKEKTMGRPMGSGKYDKSMDEKVVEVLAEGGSMAEVAKALDIDYSTLHTWRNDKNKATFSNALRYGLTLRDACWSKLFREIGKEKGNINALIYAKGKQERVPIRVVNGDFKGAMERVIERHENEEISLDVCVQALDSIGKQGNIIGMYELFPMMKKYEEKIDRIQKQLEKMSVGEYFGEY